jgi:hypothetical protein
MPLLAPVTIAIFPLSSFATNHPFVLGTARRAAIYREFFEARSGEFSAAIRHHRA